MEGGLRRRRDRRNRHEWCGLDGREPGRDGGCPLGMGDGGSEMVDRGGGHALGVGELGGVAQNGGGGLVVARFTGGSASPGASRKACVSWWGGCCPAGGRVRPNTATGPGPACGLACQVAWMCGQCSVRWRMASAAARALVMGRVIVPPGPSLMMTNGGVLVVEDGWAVAVWGLRWFSHSFICPGYFDDVSSSKGNPRCRSCGRLLLLCAMLRVVSPGFFLFLECLMSSSGGG